MIRVAVMENLGQTRRMVSAVRVLNADGSPAPGVEVEFGIPVRETKRTDAKGEVLFEVAGSFPRGDVVSVVIAGRKKGERVQSISFDRLAPSNFVEFVLPAVQGVDPLVIGGAVAALAVILLV